MRTLLLLFVSFGVSLPGCGLLGDGGGDSGDSGGDSGDSGGGDSGDSGGGDSGDSGGGDSGGGDSGDSGPPCESAGFASGDTWAMPDTDLDASGYPFDAVATWTAAQSCGGSSSDWAYSLLDLTGDGTPDLVVTRSECDDNKVGKDRWIVYPGTGSGFGAGQTWTLPDTDLDASGYPWDKTADYTAAQPCGGDNVYWSYTTTDLTGDGTPDLVVTRSECDDAKIGKDRWVVYPGTGSGFGSAQTWSLPGTNLDASGYPYEKTGDYTAAQPCGGDSAYWSYTTVDATGDGKADLVVTRSECDDAKVGKDRWVVYPGTGSGFGSGQTWTLPDTDLDASDYPYEQTGEYTAAQSCGGDDVYWAFTTMDATGDGKVDIVVTRSECDDAKLGKDRWVVYPGTGSGFGSGQTWTLPDTNLDASGYPYEKVADYTAAQPCGGDSAYWSYTTMDVTGDGAADLVVTQAECDDPKVGKDRWVVYPGTGSGFSAGETWAMPDTDLDASDYPWAKVAESTGAQGCGGSGSDWTYTTMDATEDGLADLVVTRAECDDAKVGKDRWIVYPGACE